MGRLSSRIRQFGISANPFYNVTPPLITGIAIQNLIQPNYWLGIILLCLIAIGLFFDIKKENSRPLLWLSFTILGYLITSISHINTNIPYDEKVQFISKINSVPQTKGRYQKVDIQIISYKKESSYIPAPQKSILYVDTSQVVAIGEVITYQAKHRAIDSTYGQYLKHQGVTGRQYTYRISKLGGDTTLLNIIDIYRKNIANKITTADTINSHATALMQALTVGDKTHIDKELRSDYQRAGTSHLLAISGLHVGIIFTILNFLLGWLRLYRKGYLIMGVIVISFLWLYAFFAGLSPSVLRATIMFTIMQCGVLFSRSSNSLNALLFSAFILLIWNPNYLYDLGFQLSYLAMIGILTLYQPIRMVWKPKNRIIQEVWNLTVISFSAQIWVLPLVAHTFGQIPLVGIIVNLLVWITVPMIILGTILYIIVSIPFISNTTIYIATFQNQAMAWVSSHSWAAIEGIKMPLWLCLTLYAIIVLFTIWINQQQSWNLRKMLLRSTYKV